MRKFKILICILSAISFAAYGAHYVKERMTADNNAPVISFREEVVYVDSKITEEALLEGVTAEDKEDGDITKNVQVASISYLKKGNERTVEYVVFDGANHFATATRTMVYREYIPPRIYLKEPLRFRVNEYEKRMNNLEIVAVDGTDDDLTDKIRISYGIDMYDVEAGQYTVAFQVNNRLGDTCLVKMKMELVDAVDNQMYYPMLSDYIAYTTVGTELDLVSYLTGVMSSTEEYLFGQEGTPEGINESRVVIDSKVDYSTPGVYEVEYSYTTRSEVTATTVLTVVVEE